MRHTNMCRTLRHSDAAKRISDEYNMHYTAGGSDVIGHWLAFSMQDGTSDHQVYATRYDAVRHQHHNESTTIFVQIRPTCMPVCEAEQLLSVQRKMFDAGVRLTDLNHRAGGRTVIPRLAMEDQRAQVRSIVSGGAFAPTNLTYGRPR